MTDFVEISTECDEELESNFRNLGDSFREKYNVDPDFFVRVPGRVNLIGEHIDYNGYNVCPMAIKQCILAGVKTLETNEVFLSNVDSQKYKDYTTRLNNFEIKIEHRAPFWYEYILCGFQGILETDRHAKLNGIIMHINGTIPPAAGLSSSSALVCLAALSLCRALQIRISKREIAVLAAKAERYIGTAGGGMDQAIIFNAKKGFASEIWFDPLTWTNVQIPQNGAFVIVQSMVTKNKAASNDFNSRVVECRLASLIIAKKYELKNWTHCSKPVNLQRALNYELEKMLEIVYDTLHDGFYTKNEICEILEVNEQRLEENFLTKNTQDLPEFKLKDRILHVFGEALRVKTFCDICRSSKSLTELGRLMCESHTSLQELYECSHPALDKLVRVCLAKGALGARLTGAGWGGCVVALVYQSAIQEFIKSVRSEYYDGQISALTNTDTLGFATKPDSGAEIFDATIVNS